MSLFRIFSPAKAGRESRSVEEEKIIQCTGCREKFTMINRKHHCGKCGNLFFGNCTSNKENLNNGAIKERICISCSTRAFLLRRKAKAPKKIAKSIVVKSAKFGKLESWDSPEPVKHNISQTTESLPAAPCVPVSVQVQVVPAPKSPPAARVPVVYSPEEDESDSLISKPALEVDGVDEDEDENGLRRMNQGMLCILPPTVFSFLFGAESNDEK